jgi:hypothetical protein
MQPGMPPGPGTPAASANYPRLRAVTDTPRRLGRGKRKPNPFWITGFEVVAGGAADAGVPLAIARD